MTKSELIKQIGKASKTPQHELLVKFMNEYNLIGLKDATEEQLNEFIKNKFKRPKEKGYEI